MSGIQVQTGLDSPLIRASMRRTTATATDARNRGSQRAAPGTEKPRSTSGSAGLRMSAGTRAGRSGGRRSRQRRSETDGLGGFRGIGDDDAHRAPERLLLGDDLAGDGGQG